MKDELIYEGSWANDKFHGNGTLYYEDGSYYIGSWNNDQRHGEGTLYNPDKTIKLKGIWIDDVFNEASEKKR